MEGLEVGTPVKIEGRGSVYVVERAANSRGMVHISKLQLDPWALPYRRFAPASALVTVGVRVCTAHGTAPHAHTSGCP